MYRGTRTEIGEETVRHTKVSHEPTTTCTGVREQHAEKTWYTIPGYYHEGTTPCIKAQDSLVVKEESLHFIPISLER